MSIERLTFNGIDGASGEYLLPAMSPAQLGEVIRGEPQDAQSLKELRWWHQRATQGGHYGVVEGIDPKNLAETGWGVIFAQDADPAIREALGELLDHRRSQATQLHEHYYTEYRGDQGYRAGESKQRFLSRHGAGARPGRPEQGAVLSADRRRSQSIPYAFQYQLDVQYAVGRIAFDTLDEYANYARSVVAAETSARTPSRRAVFFGTRNPGDAATELSCGRADRPAGRLGGRGSASWTSRDLPGRGGDQGAAGAPAGWRRHTRAALHRLPRHGLPQRPPAPAAASGRAAVPGLAGPRGLERADSAGFLLRRRRHRRRCRRRLA